MKDYLAVSTPNLNKSIDFYKSLDFEYRQIAADHFVSAKDLVIKIEPKAIFRSGIKLYLSDLADRLESLRASCFLKEDPLCFTLQDPSGSYVYLLKENEQWALEPINHASYLGNYSGYSIEVLDMLATINIYQLLGFKKTMGGIEQGWISMENESGFAISIMSAGACPHQFHNPSLSFFNGTKNLEIIKRLRTLNLKISEEISVFNKEGIVDNVIINDPGGLGFFVFSD